MSIVHELSCEQTRIVGMKQVLRYAQQRMLKKVFIAKDADEAIREKLEFACAQNKIGKDKSHTMQQIGSACHIEVGSACAAVLKQRG